MKKLNMTLIIPTLNRPNSLKETVKTICCQESVPSQIIVIDQSKEIKIQRQNQEIESFCSGLEYTYLFLKTPSSTRARNIGILHAKEEIIVFLDDDVEVNNNTLENLYYLMKREEIAMIGVIDETLPLSKGKFGYIFNFKSIVNRKIGHVTLSMHGRYPNKIKGEVSTMWAMGFCFAVKRSLLDKWNIKFDEKLKGYAYAEDLDFTYSYYKSAKKENKRCILSEKITVKHLESREYRIPEISATYRYVINREYLAYKHGMKLENKVALVWSNFGQFLLRIIQKTNPLDILKAQYRCIKIRKYLKEGIITPKFYEKNFEITQFKKEIDE